MCGPPDRNPTYNLALRRGVLYAIELRGECVCVVGRAGLEPATQRFTFVLVS